MVNQQNYVNPNLMHWTQSGVLMVMVILGGVGTLAGGLWGALLLLTLEDVFAEYTVHWQFYVGWILLAVVLMAVASAVWAPQWQNWEERLASRTWSLANPQATERRVVVVDIDEKSTQALGPWPWPRDRVASLLTGLDAYGVNLKVVDVLFDGAQDPAQAREARIAPHRWRPAVSA